MGLQDEPNMLKIVGQTRDAEGTVKPVEVLIAPPVVDSEDENGSCYCRFKISPFYQSDKRIYGVDKRQAIELCVRFVNSSLQVYKTTDINEKVIVIDVKSAFKTLLADLIPDQ